MTHRPLLGAAFAAAAVAGCILPALAAPPPLAEKAVDDAGFSVLPDTSSERAVPEVVKAEVLLDRARFSPGAIDGIDGENFRHALSAYQMQMGLSVSGRLDQATWDRLTAGAPAPLKSVEVTKAEAEGPFTRTIPADFEAQSKLEHMGYHDIREELGERYHMSEPLLMALNPGSTFATGRPIVVADVDEAKPTDKVARIVVDKTGHDVEALAADGRLIAHYPASIGSEEKPAPTGDFTVHRVDRNPIYTYDPKYHFKGVSAKEPFSIAPGPNNPVGLVWMDLGGDGYGIHGTPDPEAVGQDPVTRLHPHDQLGRAQPRRHGGQGHARVVRRRAGLDRPGAARAGRTGTQRVHDPGSGHSGIGRRHTARAAQRLGRDAEAGPVTANRRRARRGARRPARALCHSRFEVGRDLSAIVGQLLHHFAVQPHVHRRGIVRVARVMQFLGEFLAVRQARIEAEQLHHVDDGMLPVELLRVLGREAFQNGLGIDRLRGGARR